MEKITEYQGKAERVYVQYILNRRGCWIKSLIFISNLEINDIQLLNQVKFWLMFSIHKPDA